MSSWLCQDSNLLGEECGENKGFPTLGHVPFTGHWVQRGLASLLHAIDIRPTDARQFPPS